MDNIVDNSLQASPQDAPIAIRISEGFSFRPDDGVKSRVRIEIEAPLARLADGVRAKWYQGRYRNVTGRAAGNGQGLPDLVQRATLAGGNFVLDLRPGGGTVSVLDLPAVPPCHQVLQAEPV